MASTALAGVDTWSVCWYLRAGSAPAKAMQHLATVPAPRSRLVEEEVSGHRVGWFPGSGLLYAEGSPAQEELARVEDLPDHFERLTDELADRGILPPAHRVAPMVNAAGDTLPVIGGTGFAGVRRLDMTVDVHRDPPIGAAMLRGVAAVEPPGQLRSNVYRAKRGRSIETVTLEGVSGKVARVYDKGVETGTLRPGERVRFEDQRRFKKGARPTVESIAEGYGKMLFRQRFEFLRQATKGLKVTSGAGVAQKIQELVDDGELTPSEAAKLSGLLFLEAHGVEMGSRTTRWRNRKAVARAGLLIGDEVVDETVIDLGQEVEEAFSVMDHLPGPDDYAP